MCVYEWCAQVLYAERLEWIMLLCIELILIKNAVERTYLQKTKHKEILEHVSGKKDEGGLELIDLADRIQTLKLQVILNAGDQSPE